MLSRLVRARLEAFLFSVVAVCLCGLVACSAPSGDQPACTSGTAQATAQWFLAGEAPQDYAIETDSSVSQSGAPTEKLSATAASPTSFGTVMQTISPRPDLDQRLTFRAVVKTIGIGAFSSSNGPGEAGLWMRVDGSEPDAPLAFYNMSDHPLVGSQDWTPEEVTLDVASGATSISFGLWLSGPGEVWLDQVTLTSCGEGSGRPDRS
jgi:hypothetical protein